MNRERFKGIVRQFAGKINEVTGNLAGDPVRAATGIRAQRLGKAEQLRAVENEKSERQLRSFRHCHRNWLS